MAIDFAVPVEELSDEAAAAEMSEIRSSDLYLGPAGNNYKGGGLPGERDKHIERLTALYARKHPEPESRKAELPENRGLHDVIRKAGFNSPDDIKALTDSDRQRIANEKMVAERTATETTLKNEWGSERYEEKLGYAKAITDTYLTSKADREFIEGPAGNDPEYIRRLSELGEYVAKKYPNREVKA